MTIRVSKIVPKGYAGITLWPFGIYVSDEKYLRPGYESLINHEKIHWEQQKELLGLLFYVLYGLEWLVRRALGDKDAYRHLSFEMEAYTNQANLSYLEGRKHYAWIKYMFKKNA